MKILVTICARGGSKGIPGKNIKPINGKPLIFYTLQLADLFQKYFDNTDIVLSTDNEEIKKLVNSFGIDIDTSYTRPEYLSSDHAGKIDTIKDILNYSESKSQTKYDMILDLDVTSPLRNLSDLKTSLKMLLENPDAYNLFSVSPANKNPYFNMVELQENGYYSLCKNGKFFSRQMAPKVYELNASFYLYRKLFFDLGLQTAVTDKSIVYEVPHICFDLDHRIDFEFLSFLLSNNKLDFEL